MKENSDGPNKPDKKRVVIDARHLFPGPKKGMWKRPTIIKGPLLERPQRPTAESLSEDGARKYAWNLYGKYSNRDVLINEYIEWGNKHPGEGPFSPKLTRAEISMEIKYQLWHEGQLIRVALAGRGEKREKYLRDELNNFSQSPDGFPCTRKFATAAEYLKCIGQLPPNE